MKIYIMTDLEGVSGVVQFEDRKDESIRNINLRQKYSRLLTGEINAAVESAFSAGAKEILVEDGHGSGYTIDFEKLDSRVKVLHGGLRPAMLPGIDETFDAIMIIGAHSKAGTRRGVLAHSMSCSVREIRINGNPIGEIGIFAFCAGAFGVPLIFVSGDKAACVEAEAIIPNVVTAAVKEGISRYAAIASSPKEAGEKIEVGVKKAIKNIKKIKPFVLNPPFSYQTDEFRAGDDFYISNPVKLPKTWVTEKEIRAKTAKELIGKVWGNEV